MPEINPMEDIENEFVRRTLMLALNLKPEQEFYLKIAKERTHHQYSKLPADGYIGIDSYDSTDCFLVKFRFARDTYDFNSNCGYMSAANYKSAFQGLLNLEYEPVFKINTKNPFYIQIIDNISIFDLSNDEEEEYDFTVRLIKYEEIFLINFEVNSRIDLYDKDVLSIDFPIDNVTTVEEAYRRWIIYMIGAEYDKEFYVKIFKPKTTLQYGKLLREGYLGIKDYDMGVAFLVKFKFSLYGHKLVANTKYISDEVINTVMMGLLSNEYIMVDDVNIKNRIYIHILEEMSIYRIDYDEDMAQREAELEEILDAEVEYYNSLDNEIDEDMIIDETDNIDRELEITVQNLLDSEDIEEGNEEEPNNDGDNVDNTP